MVASEENVVSATGIDKGSNNQVPPIPAGNYTLVGIDIDTTGRRLIDEIVQLAAYTPNDHFEQYIMPYMNLNPAARQRHQVRVISIGFYRMLKSMQTYKIIKSKSEVAALTDFLNWLEALKAKDPSSQGIVLVCFEERKFIPYMILESLKKYNLLDRFLSTVKSVVNARNLTKATANSGLQRCSLRKLQKILASQRTSEMNKDKEIIGGATEEKTDVKLNIGFDGNASVRAKLAYNVALYMSNQGNKDQLESAAAYNKMLSVLTPYALPLQNDINELQYQNENLERQNSFRPVFLNYFKTTLYHRVRAVKFRIILAEHSYDLQKFNAIWTEKKKEGLLDVVQSIQELKPNDKTELAELFDSYFDPAKTTIKPVVKNNRRRNRRTRNTNNKNEGLDETVSGTEQGAGGDKSNGGQQPDSTTKSPGNMNGRPKGRRQPRSRNTSMKGQTSVANTEVNNIIAGATSAEAVVPVAAPMAVAASVPVVAAN